MVVNFYEIQSSDDFDLIEEEVVSQEFKSISINKKYIPGTTRYSELEFKIIEVLQKTNGVFKGWIQDQLSTYLPSRIKQTLDRMVDNGAIRKNGILYYLEEED